MNCRSAGNLFSAFLDDELNAAERRNFESHLLGCRRCSQTLRELKGAMALVLDTSTASADETSPHFEDDVLSRIRSGEAMRPSVVEWLHGLLAPVSFRPLLAAGAGVCAVVAAVVLFQGQQAAELPRFASRDASVGSVTALPADPASSSSNRTSSGYRNPSGAAPSSATPNTTLASAAPAVPVAKVTREAANGIVEIADRVIPSKATKGEPTGADSQFVDEYVTDHFFLQRGTTTPDPHQSTIVPVTDKASDDVYIEF
jgi:anti-sigma factor RsiW